MKVCFPVTPYDAKGMMNAALAGTDPVVFFESQKLYEMCIRDSLRVDFLNPAVIGR